MRYMTKEGKCSKQCSFFKECKGFRNKEGRCPEWTSKKFDPKDICRTEMEVSNNGE